MAAETKVTSSFFSGAMPKEEIGALRFLKEHDEFDGRGVVVAVFDTGIDPGVEGLKTTSDGKPKILDILDGSGCGDVDMSKVVELNKDGCLTALSGKELRVNEGWQNPSGKWRVGTKNLFDLHSSSKFKTRCKKHRLKQFELQQRSALEIASKALAMFDSENPKPNEDEKKKKHRAELQSRVTLLSSMMESYDDPGPILHCVVWHDGSKWVAALDTTELYDENSDEGKLADFVPITNYRDGRQYSTFGGVYACNFVCNIYDEGNLLSIVVDDSLHGTHVAGIISGNHPEDPDMNGIAPGAQIVSFKIGDSRLQGMETPKALVRAIVGAHANSVDVSNMSYGEPVWTPNTGRFSDLLQDLTFKHRSMFICASGNSGPGLTSVNAPSDTDVAIGVGAYISSSLAAAGHSSLRKVEGQIYSFSSRNPHSDGSLGVHLCAPGGAISVVPQWTEESRKLANGTSMASPNACGGVALLISALKATGRKPSPSLIRRALENTCVPVDTGSIPHCLTYGRGLLQVEKAWEFLENIKDLDIPDVWYNIKVQGSNGGPGARGIYIREPLDVCKQSNWTVNVSTRLQEDEDIKEHKLAVEDRMKLESTADWVTCPDALLITYNGRTFEITVDTTNLEPGVHYAEIQASDIKHPVRGILFRVPVTVCIPVKASNNSQTTFALGKELMHPGKEIYKFISAPENATWAEVIIKAGMHEDSKVYTFDISQHVPGLHAPIYHWQRSIRLSGDSISSYTVPVFGGRTLAIAFGQYWSSGGTSEIEVEVDFHGLKVEGSHLHLDGGGGLAEFQVTAALRRETLEPSASLESVSFPLKPLSEARVEPVTGPRDALPEGRYPSQIVLTYSFKAKEAGKFTPTIPQMDNQLYDCLIDAKSIMIHDENKKCLNFQDIYPSPVTLKKGDYTIRVLVQHEKAQFLEKLKDMILVMVKTLEKSISVPIYSSRRALLSRGAQFERRKLSPGETVTLALGNPTDELPKDCVPGSLMAGKIALGKLSLGNGTSPRKLDFTYTVPPAKESSAGDQNDSKEEKSAHDRITEGVRDAKIKILEGLDIIKDSESYASLLKELNEAFPNHVPLLSANLKNLDALTDKDRAEKLPEVIKAAVHVQKQIDQKQLAMFLARKTPKEGKDGAKEEKEMKKMESALIAALKAHAGALLDSDKGNNAEIEVVFNELGKWVDTTDATHAVLKSRIDAANERWAEAISSLDKALASDDRDKSKDKKLRSTRAEYFRELGWLHWECHSQACLSIDYPAEYNLF